MVRKRAPTAGLRRDGAGENLASVDGLPWPLYGRHKAQLRGAVTPQGRSFSKSHHIDFHGALNGHTETAIELKHGVTLPSRECGYRRPGRGRLVRGGSVDAPPGAPAPARTEVSALHPTHAIAHRGHLARAQNGRQRDGRHRGGEVGAAASLRCDPVVRSQALARAGQGRGRQGDDDLRTLGLQPRSRCALDLLPLARAALRPEVQAVLRCRDARSPTGHAPRPSRQSLHQAFLCLLKVKQKGDMGRMLKAAMGEGSSKFYNPAENAGKKESKCACCSPPSARACVAARRRLSRTSLSRLAYVDLPYGSEVRHDYMRGEKHAPGRERHSRLRERHSRPASVTPGSGSVTKNPGASAPGGSAFQRHSRVGSVTPACSSWTLGIRD